MALISSIPEKGAVVFSFYNVVNQENKGVRDSIGLTVDPELLKANLTQLLDSGHTAASLNDIIDGKAPDGSFSIILSDGYDLDHGKDSVIEFAKANNIPLSFSLPTNLVGQNAPSWTNRIEIALQDTLEAANNADIQLSVPNSDEVICFANVPSAINARNRLKDLKPADMDGNTYADAICTNLTKALDNGTTIKATHISDSPFDNKMSWSQIKSLANEGHEIISHGAAHTDPFTNLSNAQIRDDLNAARFAFKEKANVSPTIVTYPEGKADERVEQTLRKQGYKAAFTLEKGIIVADTNRFRLPRYEVTQDMLEM